MQTTGYEVLVEILDEKGSVVRVFETTIEVDDYVLDSDDAWSDENRVYDGGGEAGDWHYPEGVNEEDSPLEVFLKEEVQRRFGPCTQVGGFHPTDADA
jgi:hypothetical protein